MVNIGIRPNVNSFKTNRDVRQGTCVRSRIIRLTNNQTKKPKKSDHSQKRRESDDKNAVVIAKTVSQMGCVSQDSELLLDAQRGKQARGNPMQKVLGPIRRIRFTQSTLRQATIREKKGPSFGKIQVKNPHHRIPYAMKFEDRSHEETERQQRCARGKAWTLPKTFSSSNKKKTRLHYSRVRKNGSSRLRKQKSRRKESLW